ncbi:MAG TPA: nucleotidyltransferase family protein [Thermodesulfobacteriota bacterium]|nr:nucleotidyltransferase family protein [Thermodesulfobacteriota bacterium]
MQAFILAGGLGTRLRPITYTIPKPMVTVLGRPFLSYQLDLLRYCGVTDVVLSVGYLGEKIREYFGDGSSMEVSIRYSFEQSPKGTGGALKAAEKLLEDEFFVIYADSYLPVDLRVVEGFFRATGRAGLLVACDNSEDTLVLPNVSVDKDRFVTAYEKDSNRAALTLVEAGVLAFRKKVLDLLPEGPWPLSLEKVLFPKLIESRELVCFETDQRFYDIGSPERLRRFQEYLNDHIKNAL